MCVMWKAKEKTPVEQQRLLEEGGGDEVSVEENKIRKTCERYRALVRRVSLECLLFPSRRKEEMGADCS